MESYHKITRVMSCVLYPAIVGVLTGILIFLFKITSSKVMHISENIYSAVRENPKYLPLLILGVTAIGFGAAFLLKYAKECRGGGIPTAIASIRGLIPMKWLQGLFGLFLSSMFTYIAGVPLGNEGPSVQMGAAAGKATSDIGIRKNKRAWERYMMTGGACSGFAIATGAPISGIIFALEEAHRRFSPAIFMVASISVLTGTITQRVLSSIFNASTSLFHLTIDEVLPLKSIWIPMIIGVVCGLCAILFTHMYNVLKSTGSSSKFKLPFMLRITSIFTTVAILGFFSADFIGSGHSLIDKILERKSIWYIILLAFVIRGALLIFSNTQGVSGGIFIPTLAFGAIIAALVAEIFISTGLISEEYHSILIVVGMTSFLSASSRIPLTALVFAAEALCVTENILSVAVGVIIAYFVAEASGKESYTDTVIETRTETAHKDRLAVIVDTNMTVQPGAFATHMELRDIIWPPTCVILSISKKHSVMHEHSSRIEEGDTIHLHYRTYDTRATQQALYDILGEQPKDKNAKIRFGNDHHVTPLE